MVHDSDHSSMSSMSAHSEHSTMTSMSSMASMHGGESNGFCSGDGTVMLNGFQDAAVDTETKYAFAVLGSFALGFSTEMIRYQRALLAQKQGGANDFVVTAAFAVQMVVAYFLMLLVMLYEYVFLIAIIVGLALGHFVTLKLNRARQQASLSQGKKLQVPTAAGSSGTPCCNNDVCA